MELKKLMLLALVIGANSVKAQIVYGDDEKAYVLTSATSISAPVYNKQDNSQISDVNNKYKISALGANWFMSIRGGASLFLGAPKGCGDFFDKTNYTLQYSIGKWHSRFFGTRAVFQGFEFGNIEKRHTGFQNIHGDLMLNLSSYYRRNYENMPKWNVIPYVGAGIIRNTKLKNNPFAISYGIVCGYRVAKRLNITAELGGTSTFQDFDGTGKKNHFGDNLFTASIGLTADIGKLGWKKKNKNDNILPIQPKEQVVSPTPFPRNDYEGLRRLRERLGNNENSEYVEESGMKYATPVLFFFKINSDKLIDRQQIINIAEIAGAVKEYDLKVKIMGAADSQTGNEKINRKLSIKRAKYIAKLLYKAGVPKEKMTAESEGGIDTYKPYTANRHTCVIVYK